MQLLIQLLQMSSLRKNQIGKAVNYKQVKNMKIAQDIDEDTDNEID